MEAIGEWRVRFAEQAPREALVALVDGLDSVDPVAVVKQSRVRRVVRIPLPDGSVAFVKHAGREGAARRWPWLGSRSRALEEFENLERVRALGVAAVEPLAWAERRDHGMLAETLLITRGLPDARSLAGALAESDGAERERLVADLASAIRRLHDRGLWHRDLHRGNVLVGRPSGAERELPVLVDLQKLRALPLPLPGWLRSRDLAMIGPGDGLLAGLLERYAAAGSPMPVAPLARRVAHAEVRRRRTRLRSRGRRCIQPSSRFRVERVASGRLFRRADIEASAVLGAVDDHLAAVRGMSGARVSRVEGVPGGAAARARNPVERAGGGEAAERSAGAVAVHEFDEGWMRRLAGFELRRRGMRAWRRAHAALLRGIETPVPLALLEERRWGRVVRSFLLTRWEDGAQGLGLRLGSSGSPDAVLQELGRFLACMHESGLSHRRLGLERLLVRGEPDCTILLADPRDLRVASRTSGWRRRRDLRRLAAGIAAATGLPVAEVGRRMEGYRTKALSASTSR